MNRPHLLSLVAHGLWERIQYPALLLVLGGFWLALAGFFGATAFGFPYLFWHADAEIAICSGLAIGVLLGEWCLVNFTLDSGRAWMKRWAAELSDQQVLMRYLFWTSLLFAALFIPTPFFYRVGHDLVKFNLVRAGMSAMAIITGVTVYICLINGLSQLVQSQRLGMPTLRRRTERGLIFLKTQPLKRLIARLRGQNLQSSAGGVAIASPDPMNMVWVHAVSGILFWIWLLMLGVVSIAYVVCDRYSPWLAAALSPGVLTCALLIIAIRTYGFLIYHLQRLYFASMFSILVLYVAVGYYDWFGHKYELPGIDSERQFANADQILQLQHMRAVATEEGSLRDTDREALEQWRQRIAAEGRAPILVLVAASGGGIRASIWTTAVLSALERVIPDLPYQTRIVTGASGGMVGAAGYVGSLQAPGAVTHHAQAEVPWPVERVVESATRDSLTPTARTLFFRDLPRQFIPWLGGVDRGEALQQAWIDNSGGSTSPFAQSLQSLSAGEQAGWRPSLVFTPAFLEDGKRLVISNLNLAPLTVDRLAKPVTPADPSRPAAVPSYASVSAIESQLLTTQLGYQMDLGTAARLNASFPLISPPVSMPVENVQWSLADASFFDNYGMDTAVRWLNRHRPQLEQWRDEGKLSGILVIQIVSADEPRNQVPNRMPKWTDGWLTPLTGLLVHVMQKVVFTSDEQLEELAGHFNTNEQSTEETLFLRHMTISFRGEASLSWYLTPEEVHSLVYPFEQQGEQGQLDFQRFGSVEFQSLMERAGQPTAEMQRFRSEIQSQLERLEAWWHSRAAQTQRRQIEMSALPSETR